MNAQEALADLKQISVQIAHAVVARSDGAVEASTLADAASGERVARVAAELWEAADRARSDLGRDELAQLEVATPQGSVFVVRDAERWIAATTDSDPTVGLVFYDLKACLRTIAEGGEAAAPPERPPAPEPAPSPPEPAPEPAEEPAAAAEAAAAVEAQEPEAEAVEAPAEPAGGASRRGARAPPRKRSRSTPLSDRIEDASGDEAGTEEES